MSLSCRAATSMLIVAALAAICPAQEWTEASVIQRFIDQSPQARESRARIAIAEAEARGRSRYANPAVSYSREGAGLTEFYQAEQVLPISGRLKLLRQAGTSMVQATEAEGAFTLWQALISLRHTFYALLASQQRETIYAASLKDIENVIRVLQERERAGEGSRFDRLRGERERSELLAELSLLKAETALARGQLLAFFPAGTPLTVVSGHIETSAPAVSVEELMQRALEVRGDYRAEQRRVEQYQLEQRAAERLRYPDPVLTAGWKRADIGQRIIGNGPVVGITVPLPIFNKGQSEIARYSGEQQRAAARLQILSQQIRASIQGIAQAFRIRAQARDNYRRELANAGAELVKIATVAYQEGEIGILQLLDAYRSQRQAQLRMLDIQAAVKEAQIELERVVGEELTR